MARHILSLARGLFFTAITTLALFLVLFLPLYAIVSAAGGNIDVLMFIVMTVAYPVAFYISYVRRQREEYVKKLPEHYYFWLDMKAYVLGEGKYLIGLYAALAAVRVACSHSPGVCTVLDFVFPLSVLLKFPVWPTLIGCCITTVFSLLLVAWGHYRVWLYWHVEAGVRLSEQELQNACNRRRLVYGSLRRRDRNR